MTWSGLGLSSAAPDPADRRACRIAATGHGRDLLSDLDGRLRAAEDGVLGGPRRGRPGDLPALLARLATHVNALDLNACAGAPDAAPSALADRCAARRWAASTSAPKSPRGLRSTVCAWLPSGSVWSSSDQQVTGPAPGSNRWCRGAACLAQAKCSPRPAPAPPPARPGFGGSRSRYTATELAVAPPADSYRGPTRRSRLGPDPPGARVAGLSGCPRERPGRTRWRRRGRPPERVQQGQGQVLLSHQRPGHHPPGVGHRSAGFAPRNTGAGETRPLGDGHRHREVMALELPGPRRRVTGIAEHGHPVVAAVPALARQARAGPAPPRAR